MNLLLKSLIFILFFFTFACGPAPDAHYSDLEYRGLFKPVKLGFNHADSIEVEPIPYELVIDSIKSEHFRLSYKNSKLTIHKPDHNPPHLSNCTVYQKGIPLGFPLIYGTQQATKSFIVPLNFKGAYLNLLMTGSKEVLAYWNNLKITTENIGDTIKVIIPPFAKYTEHSHITVYAVNNEGEYDHAIIPIRKGKIIQEMSKLRKPLVEDGAPINTKRLIELSDLNYYPMINKFVQAEINMPSSLSGIYGQYDKLSEDSSRLVIQATYYQDTSVLIVNRSKDQFIDSIYNDTVLVKPYHYVLKKITH